MRPSPCAAPSWDDSSADGDLVDRDAERRQMQRALDDAEQGVGSLLLLSGVAGIGKTALAEWLSQQS